MGYLRLSEERLSWNAAQHSITLAADRSFSEVDMLFRAIQSPQCTSLRRKHSSSRFTPVCVPKRPGSQDRKPPIASLAFMDRYLFSECWRKADIAVPIGG
jgi:hypothetical protein